jgi:hypothetical protein
MTKASDNDYPSLLVTEQGSAPASPAASHQRIYIRTSDHTLVTVNSSGTVTPVGGGTSGALIFLEAHDAAGGVAQLDFTTFISSTYDTYRIIGSVLAPANSAVDLRLEVGTGGGPTYDTGNNYEWVANGYRSDGVAHTNVGATGIAKIFNSMSNTAAYGNGSFDLTLFQPQSTAVRKQFIGTGQFVDSSPANCMNVIGVSWITSGTAMTALRFIMSSGNIASGIIRIYGVTKS